MAFELTRNQAIGEAAAVETQSGDGKIRTAWHAPALTVIEIKRTMDGPSGFVDLARGTNAT